MGAPSATAPHVQWQTPAEAAASARPRVEFHDAADGPLVTLAADADVATFLNDRFSPVFFDDPSGGIAFYSPADCPLTAALHPATPAAFIAIANEIILRPEASATSSPTVRTPCPPLR